jgi:ectoine hydroxylase-related dioxygenase (phytanoyl-CoA dioxygenase family)
MEKVTTEKREQFNKDGYYVFDKIIEPAMLDRLRELTDSILAEQDKSHFEEQVATGSMVLIDWEMAYQHKTMAEFIAHPRMIVALAELGFNKPKFGHGRIISKPPHSPQLYWHEDGRYWDDPVSYTTQPIQCFLMVYLTDTTPKNGCLRVIPGSHLKRHPLHDQVPPQSTEELRTYANPDDIVFQRVEGEIDVPMKAGDLVIGYGTLFHAAHSNQTDERRTVLTMWYYPDFVNLPENTQATVADAESTGGFNQDVARSSYKEARTLMEPLKIDYTGDAELIPIQWIPGADLK